MLIWLMSIHVDLTYIDAKDLLIFDTANDDVIYLRMLKSEFRIVRIPS